MSKDQDWGKYSETDLYAIAFGKNHNKFGIPKELADEQAVKAKAELDRRFTDLHDYTTEQLNKALQAEGITEYYSGLLNTELGRRTGIDIGKANRESYVAQKLDQPGRAQTITTPTSTRPASLLGKPVL
jgi:hypothetical protein